MEIQDEKEHEHARLVLMELGEKVSFTGFVNKMREEWPDIGLIRMKNLYTAYVGWQPQVPWLSIETGERLDTQRKETP